MTYDYFYGQQAEMFTFYRVPKVLFTEDCFWNVSTDAKLLYGILLDRMNLSARNGWLDEEGRVYIIFTIEEIKGALGCAEKKAVKLLDELEKKCGLIERKRQGLGKPNLIYVKNFISGSVERQFLNCQKDNSGVVKNTIQELSKAQGNNTDTGQQYFSIVYVDGIQKQWLFYADYIVMKRDGTIWIIETKGGETKGKNKNIDDQIENKFNAFKAYASGKELRWGFVRDKDNQT